jgi:hypothetical protein
MANVYKLVSIACDTKEVAAQIMKALNAIPAQSNGTSIVVASKVSVRVVKPTDEKVPPFTKHVCQVLGTPSILSHASMLATFAGAEHIAIDAPDSCFRTSVVLTDSALSLLTFSEEAEPAK